MEEGFRSRVSGENHYDRSLLLPKYIKLKDKDSRKLLDDECQGPYGRGIERFFLVRLLLVKNQIASTTITNSRIMKKVIFPSFPVK